MPVLLFLSAACHNSSAPKVTHDSVAVVDTVVRDVWPRGDKDTASRPAQAVAPAKKEAASEGEEGEDLQSIYDGYVATYTRPCVIDSSFTLGADRFKLHVEHFCTMDSGITVPKSYVRIYKIDSFVTHNFITRVRLDRNGKTVAEKTIHKHDFDKALFPEERQFGAMFCPVMHLEGGNILLHYSISIPLTDVGVGAYAVIQPDGSIEFRDDH